LIATPSLPVVKSMEMDEILADALVLNWGDVMPEPTSGLIHIEYHVEALGSVEFVKVWASTIWGYWNLVCEHWMRWNTYHQGGLNFSNGYKSDELSGMLDQIMQHQEIFLLSAAPCGDRMIQVSPPTDSERIAASNMMDVFHERLAG
jgi:hypothetical protein